MPPDESPSSKPPAEPSRPPTEALTPRSARYRRQVARRGPGRYLRLARLGTRTLRGLGGRRWVATEEADRPRTRSGRARQAMQRLLFGAPLASEREGEERLAKLRALPIFASDALSSSAYATEEILLVLVLAGTGYLGGALPISIAIVCLLLLVVASYRQTVYAYPEGGGAYSVAKENLGAGAGLIAAAALLTDYILTVAVSISAGSLAIVSAVPELEPVQEEIAIGSLIVITAINLRGVRESGMIFSVPTYAFIVAFGSMIGVGVVRLAFGLGEASLLESAQPGEQVEATHSLTLFLILRAFSSGATALTGVEAIANGVTAFKAPAPRNASATMAWMGGILAAFFIGATFLAMRLGVVPVEGESVISQVGRGVFGGGTPPYYFLQITTALVLVLAANTAFNGFPRLASLLAQDRYLPRRFANISDRLAFSTGILVLSTITLVVLVAFNADTHRLIPLYAVGVFMAFTLSQGGMLLRLRRLRPAGWRRAAFTSGIGTLATGVVLIIVGSTKFAAGAWFVLVLIPVMVLIMVTIQRHYAGVARVLTLSDDEIRLPPRNPSLPMAPVVVPVRELDLTSLRALQYARNLSQHVTAVHIARELHQDVERFEQRWERLLPDIPLVVIESPYRTFAGPFLAYLDQIAIPPGTTLTIVLPEFQPRHRWQWFLHNRAGKQLEQLVEPRPEVYVVRATVHAAKLDEERRRLHSG